MIKVITKNNYRHRLALDYSHPNHYVLVDPTPYRTTKITLEFHPSSGEWKVSHTLNFKVKKDAVTFIPGMGY